MSHNLSSIDLSRIETNLRISATSLFRESIRHNRKKTNGIFEFRAYLRWHGTSLQRHADNEVPGLNHGLTEHALLLSILVFHMTQRLHQKPVRRRAVRHLVHRLCRGAKAEGIVAGTSDFAFEPEREVTREELCTILYRCLVRLGIETADEELEFSDSDQVSEWAIRALQASVGAGLIVGYDDEVRPADSTLRSEGAAIFARLIRMLLSMAGK